jgi:hypothetical protein
MTGCGTRTIKLLVAVTDADGNPILGLAQDAFHVFENGVQKAVSTFVQPPAAPADGRLSVGLAYDLTDIDA